MVAKLEPKLRQSAAIHVLKAIGLYGQNIQTDSREIEKNRQISEELQNMLSVVSALAYHKVTPLPIIIGHFPFHWQIPPPIYGVIPAKK